MKLLHKHVFHIALAILLSGVCSFYPAHAQVYVQPPPVSAYDVTPDSRFYTLALSRRVVVSGGFVYKHAIRVYHVQSRRYLAGIPLETDSPVEKVQLSDNGQLLMFADGNRCYLLDLKGKKLLFSEQGVTFATLLQGGRTLLVRRGSGLIEAIDTGSGTSLFKLERKQWPYGNPQVSLTDDGRYLLLSGQGHYQLLTFPGGQSSGSLSALSARFLPGTSQLVALQYEQRLIKVAVYQPGNGGTALRQVSSFDCQQYKSTLEYNYKEGCSLSPSGEYVAFCAKKMGKTWGIGVYEVSTGQQVADFPDNPEWFRGGQQPYYWGGNEALLVPSSTDMLNIVNLKNGQTDSLVSGTSYNNVVINSEASLMVRYNSGFQGRSTHKRTGKGLEVHSLVQRDQWSIRKSGYTWRGSTEDGEYIFAESGRAGKVEYGFFRTNRPESRQRFYSFSDRLYQPGREQPLLEDGEAPPGYKHYFLERIVPVSKLKKGLKLHLVPGGTSSPAAGVSLTLHLLDEEGNHYTGIPPEDWQQYICEATLVQNGKSIPVENFRVEERPDSLVSSLGMALVLDHSGSMGEDRALVMQQAAGNIVREKRLQDQVSLLKYDDEMLLESPLEQNADSLLQRLAVNGLGELGGGTALLDAGATAVAQLARLPAGYEKMILLLTDGYENSSFITARELAMDARRAGVKIFTVGYGEFVDTRLLRTLAGYTGGVYSNFYNREFFERMMRDVYLKRRTGYQMRFDVPDEGTCILKLRICHPDIEEKELAITFYNGELPPEEPVEEISDEVYDRPPVAGEVKLLDVKFHFNTIEITSDSYPEVDKMLAWLNKHPQVKIQLRGHTDSIGTAGWNQQLSQARADKLKRLLVERGILPARIETLGLGATEPVADNATEEGRAANRRTEFVVLEN